MENPIFLYLELFQSRLNKEAVDSVMFGAS